MEIGTILLQNTCDSILIDINGKSERINQHIEHWTIENITSNYYYLYNLDNGKTWKIKKENMLNYIKENKKYNIKPLFTISTEKA